MSSRCAWASKSLPLTVQGAVRPSACCSRVVSRMIGPWRAARPVRSVAPWARQAGTKKRPVSAEPRNAAKWAPLARQTRGARFNPCQTARRRYAEPAMPAADQDRYFAEMARVAEALGANPIPRSRAEARRLIDAMRPALRCDARTREVAQLVLSQRAPSRIAEPFQALTMQAAIDLLPAWARRMHGLPSLALSLPLVRAGTLGVARTLRWAFA